MPLLLFPQLLLAGYIRLYGLLMPEGEPATWLGRLSDLMPIRWSFELLAVTEYNAMKTLRTGLQGLESSSPEGDLRELSETIGFVNNSPQFALMAICSAVAIFMIATWFALVRKKSIH